MIQITRLLARQLRIIVKKALGSRHKPDLRFVAGPEGLRVQATGYQHAMEYHDPQPREAEQFVVPYGVLEDVQGNKEEPVRLYCPKKKVLAATWEERVVERTMQYARPKDDGSEFHAAPVSFTSNPPAILRALGDAAQCTDVTSSRYALGCVQLQGSSGQIAATDGRQLLLQSGYSFPFHDDVIFHTSDIFSCAELPQDQAVQVGKTDSHLVLTIGPWSLYFALGEGRFPEVVNLIPLVQNAKTTLELHPADAEFFSANVSRLPGGIEEPAVTMDVGSTIAVRAKTIDTQAAEIILTNSSKTGDEVTICLNRRNLVSAARMGFDRMFLFGKGNAVLARDEQRGYVFMPLESHVQAVKPSGDCLKIPSPVSSQPSASDPRPHTPNVSMNNHPSPSAVSAASPAAQPAAQQETNQSVRRRRRTGKSSGVLDQAIAVREQLRVALSGVNELIRTLKADRRSQKSLQQALDSLKQLRSAA